MTVEQARKKLGKRGERLSDSEVEEVIRTLTIIVNKAIDAAVK